MVPLLVSLAVLSPFPFYWSLWNWPRSWVGLCRGRDPCRAMSQVSAALKLLQLLALASVATRIALPPWWSWLLLLVGQALNLRVYQLLGEEGVYYGVRFGKRVEWVTEFPFGYIRDPQYTGSILSLVALAYCIPWSYIALWCSGYVFMMLVELKEEPSSRAGAS